MATLYKTNSTNGIEVFPKDKKRGFSLEELHTLVDCETIEVVGPLKDGRYMVIDESGKLLNKPINHQATNQYVLSFGPYDIIVGNALLCDDTEIK